jgi:anti-anti-sigma regulatory factor
LWWWSASPDLATAPIVTAALRPLVRAGGDVLIDVRDVTFIGSEGIHLLDEEPARCEAEVG